MAMFYRLWDAIRRRPTNAMFVGAYFLAFATCVHWIATSAMRQASPKNIGEVNQIIHEHQAAVTFMHQIEAGCALIVVGLLAGAIWRRNRGLP
jgi:heme A synthase